MKQTSKPTANDLLGEETTQTPTQKKVEPKKETKAEEAKVRMPKLGGLVAFRKAENGEIVEHIAMVMSVPGSSTSLSLNVFKQGYMDFVKSAPFSEEKQPHTWGFIDK